MFEAQAATFITSRVQKQQTSSKIWMKMSVCIYLQVISCKSMCGLKKQNQQKPAGLFLKAVLWLCVFRVGLLH